MPMFSAFLLASVLLAVTPGPGVAYIVTRTLAQGRAAGIASVAGVALGYLGNALGAALGLAALLATSPFALTVLKLGGAAYLVWLGLKALRAPAAHGGTEADDDLPRPQCSRLFRDGLVVALLNPKTALFFVAFLPQFIDARGSVWLKTATLGACFVAVAAVTDTAYVLAADVISPGLMRLRGASRIGRWASGCIFIGLGLWAAASGSRLAR